MYPDMSYMYPKFWNFHEGSRGFTRHEVHAHQRLCRIQLGSCDHAVCCHWACEFGFWTLKWALDTELDCCTDWWNLVNGRLIGQELFAVRWKNRILEIVWSFCTVHVIKLMASNQVRELIISQQHKSISLQFIVTSIWRTNHPPANPGSASPVEWPIRPSTFHQRELSLRLRPNSCYMFKWTYHNIPL